MVRKSLSLPEMSGGLTEDRENCRHNSLLGEKKINM